MWCSGRGISNFDRDVALKTLPKLPLLSEPARRQFRREALSLGRITDPCVAMAFDFGEDGGIDYLVTEYVPGLTLEAKLPATRSRKRRFFGWASRWPQVLRLRTKKASSIAI